MAEIEVGQVSCRGCKTPDQPADLPLEAVPNTRHDVGTWKRKTSFPVRTAPHPRRVHLLQTGPGKSSSSTWRSRSNCCRARNDAASQTSIAASCVDASRHHSCARIRASTGPTCRSTSRRMQMCRECREISLSPNETAIFGCAAFAARRIFTTKRNGQARDQRRLATSREESISTVVEPITATPSYAARPCGSTPSTVSTGIVTWQPCAVAFAFLRSRGTGGKQYVENDHEAAASGPDPRQWNRSSRMKTPADHSPVEIDDGTARSQRHQRHA